ncbi:MAG: hypothetical protein ACOH1E_03345 [Brevundimonas sp.]
MRPDHQEFADGVRLAAIAAVSAVLTAALVIGAGQTFMPPTKHVAAVERPAVTLANLR